MNDFDPIVPLAQAYGIATEFHDWSGAHTRTSRDTLVAVLAALDVDASSPEAAERALSRLTDERWRRLLPPTVVARQDEGTTVDVHVVDGAGVEVVIDLESGGHVSAVQAENWTPSRVVDGVPRGEATFIVPGDLPLGYHTLRASSGGEGAEALLIVAPQRLEPPLALGENRAWGWAVQLYSLTSAGSWGMGDLADLAELARWSAESHGAGYVLINPLHAAEPVAPIEASPYLPSSRRFVNPLYLRPEAIEEYAQLAPEVREEIERMRLAVAEAVAVGDRIDRDLIGEAKLKALRAVHTVPRDARREARFADYCHEQGQGLVDFAVWCVIAARHGADTHRWPTELRTPRSAAVRALAEQAPDDVAFHCWLQWLLDEQLAHAQAVAEDALMPLGIVHDLAVGVNPKGADAWALSDVFASGVSVGSPPDAFNQRGQNWSQPPWRPDRLAEVGYAPLREMVSDLLRHSGGIRVDHVMGLFRLWWVPEAKAPTEGTYVRYDHEAMVGILTLEAARAGAAVVGEDLGTVEPWVRDFLAARGVLGTSILWWELDHQGDGHALTPGQWRADCMASVTTHDLPTTAAYLAGEHIELRDRLGQLTRSVQEELVADRAERDVWLSVLRERGLIDPSIAAETADPAEVEQIVLALHRYLVMTRSRLLCPALTDAVGERRAQNLPGTADEYPNWRLPMRDAAGALVTVESLRTDPRVDRLARVFAPVAVPRRP